MKNETILLMNAEDFTSSHNSELLAHLEDCQDVRFGDTLNFPTRIRFAGEHEVPVIRAFNMYLMRLSQSVDRIIISL